MCLQERLTEVILQSLHAHPTSLESSFHRQIQAVDQLWLVSMVTIPMASHDLQEVHYQSEKQYDVTES